MNKFIKYLFCVCSFILPSCSPKSEAPQVSLVIYCGITMIHPIKELAVIFEQNEGVVVKISQEGSEALYRTLKMGQRGDIYFPGSDSYRKRYLGEGLLTETVDVGYNQASLIVRKGNPYKVQGQLSELLRKDLKVVIANHETSSTGKEGKALLEKANLYEQVVKNAALVATDSRDLMGNLEQGLADVFINWKATAFFPEHQSYAEAIPLPEDLAKRELLQLNLLSFSKHPELARKFMALASSDEGQRIFKKYGFKD